MDIDRHEGFRAGREMHFHLRGWHSFSGNIKLSKIVGKRSLTLGKLCNDERSELGVLPS